MNELIGRKVIHKTLGEAIVVSISNDRIDIEMTETGEVKTFMFPNAFKSFLTAKDDDIQKAVMQLLTKKTRSDRKIEDEMNRAAQELRSALILLNTGSHKPKESSTAPNRNASTRTPSKKNHYYSAAFKCTYCDGGSSEDSIGFRDLCSDSNIRNNILSKRNWCNTGELCMGRYIGKYTRSEYVEASKHLERCYESKMLCEWKASAGTINHGRRAGTPIKMDKTAPDKLAVLTTRLPGAREEERIIFAVFIIRLAYDGDTNESGFVLSDPDCRIELKPAEAKKMLFWNYHSNEGNLESIKWGTGLYRYLDDIEALQILRDIVSVKEGKDDHDHATNVLNAFIKRNHLEHIEIPENNGPLARLRGNRR